MLFLLLLLLFGASEAYHDSSGGGCGVFGASTGDACVCNDGYVGWQGGPHDSTPAEHVCGYLEGGDPCCGHFSNFGHPCFVNRRDCLDHCGMVARYTLCSGHGYNKRGWDRVFLQQTQLPKLFDVQTATESCNCDPGYFSSRTFATGTASCDCGTCGIRVEHCTTTVRSYFCSCHGRDNAGPEYLNTGTGDQCGGTTIDEGCAFLGDQTPGQVPWSSQCAPVYNSVSSGTPNVLCLCDHDYIGIPNGQGGQNQCNTRISVAICNGRGQDPSSGSRYPANAIALQNNQWRITGTGGFYACQCDDGFGPNTAGSTTQCSTFLPCQAPYSCGSATGRGTCGCSGTCCTCNAGFGGIACCPLKFGTTAVCNGFATAKCQNDGTCNCPPGTQDPGCCVGCDLSQECQLDGRCSCPKIAGDLCGIYGTCVASGIPVGSQLNCTCNGTSVVDVDGPTGPIAPKNVTYGGKFCCPVINGLVCGPGGSVCTSTPHPSDPLTGGCACGPGRAGRFCCPIAPGQTKECGDNGVCQTNGQCLCRDIGVTGSACELNTNCDNVVTTQECRGSGSCVFSSPGLSAYLQDLRFDDVLNLPYTTTDGQNFTDEGAVQFLRAVSRAFHGFDPLDQPQESKYYTANITACQQALAAGQGRGGCLWAMLSSCFPPRDAFIGTFSTVEAYVERAFRQLHPTRIIPPPAASPQGTFMLQESAAYTNTCLGGGQPREAMASLLSWELWLQLYRDPNNPTSLPAASGITLLPSHQGAPYHCRCTPPLSTAQIGIDSAPGGFRCQFTCPVGGTLGTTDLQVCSGFSQGVFRGACVGNNLCECSSKFSGNACQFPLTPSCFAVNSQDAEPCTNSRHGFCRRVDVPGQTIPNFNCNCSAQFTGTYCELCRCQPPSVQPQPGECNGRGQCLALSGGLFRCDCSAYLTTLYDTGDSNRIPFLAAGNACEANGTAFCANFKQAAGQPVGIGNWQVCSQRGSCVWDYNTNTGSCSCQPGYSGNRCQLSLCIPDCNMHQNCDTGSGTCGCFPFWGTPATCTPGNRTCECSQNLCDHGTPTSDGTACICDVGWKKVVSGINAGKCSVVQCRLVVHNDQGVRPCIEPQDQRCSDLSSIAQSLQQGCCVDTCPVCVLNTTSNTRSCQCDALSGSTPCYDSQNEMCLPKCHGNDVLHPNPPNCDSSTNPITCHCEHVSLLATQFRDLRCQRYTCLNGGTRFTTTCNPALQQCCDCSQTAYSGSFCTTSICGQRGTPFPNGTSCDCIPPFDHSSPARKDCDIDRCSPGTVVADPTSMTRPFYCNCPGSTFVGTNNLSCIALDCAGQHAALCSVCIHGTPFLFNRQVQCDCTGTSFTGSDCNRAVCLNGGSTNTTDPSRCVCVPPFGNQFCEQVICFNGGTPSGLQCSCTPQFTGVQCQVPVSSGGGSSSSSSTGGGAAGNASSSSTAGPVPITADTTDTLSTGAIIGIAVGGVAVIAAGVGIGIFLATRTVAPTAAAAVVATGPPPPPALPLVPVQGRAYTWRRLQRHADL